MRKVKTMRDQMRAHLANVRNWADRTTPKPEDTFEEWFGDYTPTGSNVREVASAFAAWINSDGSEKVMGSDGSGWDERKSRGLKKIFRELTELTVDLTRELRQVRGRVGVQYPDTPENRKREATIRRYQPQISPILTRLQRHRPHLQLDEIPDRDGMPHFSEDHPVDGHSHLDRYVAAANAAYVLRYFRFLYERGAFTDFRRCALRTCSKCFFPLRPERRYCSKSCQRKIYMEDPKRKDKNAADQKVYYYTKKVLDLAKLAAPNAAEQKQYEHAQKVLKSTKREQKRLASKGR